MSLTIEQKTALQTQVQAVADSVSALEVDPIPHPLQVLLDAANAQIAVLEAAAVVAASANAALRAKIDAAKAALA